jgi:hypothetical protein
MFEFDAISTEFAPKIRGQGFPLLSQFIELNLLLRIMPGRKPFSVPEIVPSQRRTKCPPIVDDLIRELVIASEVFFDFFHPAENCSHSFESQLSSFKSVGMTAR